MVLLSGHLPLSDVGMIRKEFSFMPRWADELSHLRPACSAFFLLSITYGTANHGYNSVFDPVAVGIK